MVLVTGATGILGRVLILELLKKGKKIRAAKREKSNLVEVKNSWHYYTDNVDEYFDMIEWVNMDLDDINSIKKNLCGVKEVYHCSAKVSFHPKHKKEILKTNVEGTKNILYACQEIPNIKFLFVSSIAVLDADNEIGLLDEKSIFDNKKSHSDYALSKYLSEMEVWRSYAEGMNTIIILPGVIIGSGNWGVGSGSLFPSFEKNPFSFTGGTAYVDVRDVVNIAMILMEKEKYGERYIIVSENRKYKDLADIVRLNLGKSKTKNIPLFLLKIAYIFNILLGWLVPNLKIVNKNNINTLCSFMPISNEKIKSELNYNFIPINESVKFHLENYKRRK